LCFIYIKTKKIISYATYARISHSLSFTLYKYYHCGCSTMCVNQRHIVFSSELELAMPTTSRNPLVVGRVIGEVIEHFESSIPFRVSYGNREVNNGCELKPSQVVNKPRVSVGGDDLRNFYTLVIHCITFFL